MRIYTFEQRGDFRCQGGEEGGLGFVDGGFWEELEMLEIITRVLQERDDQIKQSMLYYNVSFVKTGNITYACSL